MPCSGGVHRCQDDGVSTEADAERTGDAGRSRRLDELPLAKVFAGATTAAGAWATGAGAAGSGRVHGHCQNRTAQATSAASKTNIHGRKGLGARAAMVGTGCALTPGTSPRARSAWAFFSASNM